MRLNFTYCGLGLENLECTKSVMNAEYKVSVPSLKNHVNVGIFLLGILAVPSAIT